MITLASDASLVGSVLTAADAVCVRGRVPVPHIAHYAAARSPLQPVA